MGVKGQVRASQDQQGLKKGKKRKVKSSDRNDQNTKVNIKQKVEEEEKMEF